MPYEITSTRIPLTVRMAAIFFGPIGSPRSRSARTPIGPKKMAAILTVKGIIVLRSTIHLRCYYCTAYVIQRLQNAHTLAGEIIVGSLALLTSPPPTLEAFTPPMKAMIPRIPTILNGRFA